MLLISWWFIALIANSLFYSMFKDEDNSKTRVWLAIGLTLIDIVLIVFMFMRGF